MRVALRAAGSVVVVAPTITAQSRPGTAGSQQSLRQLSHRTAPPALQEHRIGQPSKGWHRIGHCHQQSHGTSYRKSVEIIAHDHQCLATHPELPAKLG